MASIIFILCVDVCEVVLASKLDYGFLGLKASLGASCCCTILDSEANSWLWWMVKNSSDWRRGINCTRSCLCSRAISDSSNLLLEICLERISSNILHVTAVRGIFANPFFVNVPFRGPVGNFMFSPFIYTEIIFHVYTKMNMALLFVSSPFTTMERQNSGLLQLIVRDHRHCRLDYFKLCSWGFGARAIARHNDKMRSRGVVVKDHRECVAFLGQEIKRFYYFLWSFMVI